MYILFFVYYICIFAVMAISALRIRQGFNEGNNTPIAIVVFAISLALASSVTIRI